MKLVRTKVEGTKVPSYERRYEGKCEEEIARTMCADGPAIATVEGTETP